MLEYLSIIQQVQSLVFFMKDLVSVLDINSMLILVNGQFRLDGWASDMEMILFG